MSKPPRTIGMVYDRDAYEEPSPDRAAGTFQLMGRHVAGKEFFDALLAHGTWQELVGVVYHPASGEVLRRLWQTHPAVRNRRLNVIDERAFHRTFFPTPPTPILHVPCPLVARYAWARQHGGPHAFALSGVTHTLCDGTTARGLCDLVTGPYESYDALVCTSRAAVGVVRAVTGAYCDFLRDRHGGNPTLQVRLPVIPLGVDPEKIRPPTAEQRAAARGRLGIADDETAVLFVGRLSFHSKAHPYPMLAGLEKAVQAGRRKARLLLYGWTNNEQVRAAIIEGARAFAPGVRLSLLDGRDAALKPTSLHAADVFTSLSDNLQETFGLSVLEAMASGLPVVASDWDGYRDLVVDGETGCLVPTCMIDGATVDLTSRLLFGEIGFDQFQAESNQAIAVDVAAATEAYARLFADESLRQRLGAAGRQRVLERFAWTHVVRAYEALWCDQDRQRRETEGNTMRPRTPQGPACYPAPEVSFAGHPTHVLLDDDRLQTVPAAEPMLDCLLALPLTNYVNAGRVIDAAALRAVLLAAVGGSSVGELDEVLRRLGTPQSLRRPTLAWLLKYGLLGRHVRAEAL